MFWIFETSYVEENKELYGKKLLNFEARLEKKEFPPKKMGDFLMCGFKNNQKNQEIDGVVIVHVGSREGFSKEEIIFIGEKKTNESNKEKVKRFVEDFKKIVANPKMIPNESVLLINHEKHHMMKTTSRQVTLKGVALNSKMKLREHLAQAKGQKSLTDFYKSTKAGSPATPYKKPAEWPKYKIEEITRDLRGDSVKILWLPKAHFELDASQFVSVVLQNYISQRLEASEGQPDVKVACTEAINQIPSKIWEVAVDYVDDCCESYLNPPVPPVTVKDENEETEN